MKKFKRVMALTIAMAVMFAMSACGGNPAPDSYNLSAANITVDSLTKVVGDRKYESRTDNSSDGKTDSILVNYSGASSADVQAYANDLRAQGFMDYYGVDGVQMCLAKREGDGAVIASARLSDGQLAIKLEWKAQLQLYFDETQYVSGSSLAQPGDDSVRLSRAGRRGRGAGYREPADTGRREQHDTVRQGYRRRPRPQTHGQLCGGQRAAQRHAHNAEGRADNGR